MSAPIDTHRLARAKGGSLLVTCAFLLGLSPSVQAYDLNAPEHYRIKAQPLAQALQDFSKISGVPVQVQNIPKDLTSAELNDTLSAREALTQLLSSSNLSWQATSDGTLLIDYPALEVKDAVVLGSTKIEDVRQITPGTSQLTRKQIEGLPAGNGDITSLLKTNPNVQFDNSQQSSKAPGELSPANVSINGAMFYQNAFVVDGANMNNDLNPGDSTHNQVGSVPGRSQGLAIDTDLLDTITVHDSNVSAAYGGFNGGVIEANTRAPSKDFHGKISYQTTRSDWTRYHVDDEEREKFEGASSADTYAYQPEFEKHIVRATLEGHVTDDLGLLANVTRKSSTIPVNTFNILNTGKSAYGAAKQDQERTSDNVFIKGLWQASEALTLEASLTYAPETATYYRDNALNTGYSIESGGTQFNLKAIQQMALAKVTQQVSVGRMQNSRDSDADDWHNWKQNAVKDWGTGTSSLEGGYGDIEQSQDSISYKLDVQWDAINVLNTSHRLRTGLEYQYQDFNYERLTESSVNVYALLPSGTSCAGLSTLKGNAFCDAEAGQFVNNLTQYETGEFGFSLNSWAAYVEDEIQIGRVMLRPGVRIDSDNYMNKTTVAPRLALQWDVFDDQKTVFSAGLNRYYGRNSATWALEEGRRALQHTYARAKYNAAWTEKAYYLTDSEFQELDISYDDELMFGLTQQLYGTEVGVKWVARKGRDQVRQEKVINATDPTRPSDYSTYTNNGKTDSETLTFTLTPLKPLELFGTQTSAQLAADYSHRNSNFNGYSERFEDDNNDYVYYQGQLVHISELPPTNFNHDWTYRLTTLTDIQRLNLKWSNFLRYRSELDTLKTDSRNKINGYNQVVDASYAKAFTWDMRIAWELPLGKAQAAFVNVDIYNVTDRVNASGNANDNAAIAGTVYETGRQYWLEVGYRF